MINKAKHVVILSKILLERIVEDFINILMSFFPQWIAHHGKSARSSNVGNPIGNGASLVAYSYNLFGRRRQWFPFHFDYWSWSVFSRCVRRRICSSSRSHSDYHYGVYVNWCLSKVAESIFYCVCSCYTSNQFSSNLTSFGYLFFIPFVYRIGRKWITHCCRCRYSYYLLSWIRAMLCIIATYLKLKVE